MPDPTLAQMVRSKYPGAYDDLSDQQLEAMVTKKYPGAYDDIPRTQAKAQPSGGAEGFAREFWQRANPVSWLQGMVEAARHPVDTAVNLVRSDPKFLEEAKQAAAQGDYTKAGRKVLSYLSMGLGHELDTQADLLDQGKYAEAAGAITGNATQFLAPEAVAKMAGAMRAPRLTPANPAVREAVQAAQAAGIPLDAATATDNAAVRAVQHVADRSLGGSQVATRAAQQQAEAMAARGQQLAAKAYPKPVTAEQAGQAIRDQTLSELRARGAEANAAYDQVRQIEARPENLQAVDVEQKAGTSAAAQGADATYANRFAKPGASTEQLWQGVLGDARRSGFKGSADALKAEFIDRLRSGREGLKDAAGAASEVDVNALLTDIRRLGGISDKSGTWANIAELDPRFRSTIRRKGGLGLDDLADQLRQEPKWQAIIPEQYGAEWLDNTLNDASRGAKGQKVAAGNELERALQIQGIEPGVKWWSTSTEPTKAMQLPVDLRPAREALTPLYEDLKRQAELTPASMMGDKARAFQALDKIVNGPTHLPLTTVDAALSDLKSFARADLPELRTSGQAAVLQAIGKIDDWVKLTAENAGALDALEKGRTATKAKYAIADVYDAIRQEPVKAFSQSVAPGDSAILQLRQVAKYAPDELPKIGRAYLDSLMEKATAEGGFSRADRLWADWQKLGPETKQMLFKQSPGLTKELDQFFLLAKQMAKNANSSGTAHTLLAHSQIGAITGAFTGGGVGAIVGAAAEQVGWTTVAKFLHSPAGVRLLTEGLRTAKSPAAQAAWLSKVRKFGATTGAVRASQPVEAGQ